MELRRCQLYVCHLGPQCGGKEAVWGGAREMEEEVWGWRSDEGRWREWKLEGKGQGRKKCGEGERRIDRGVMEGRKRESDRGSRSAGEQGEVNRRRKAAITTFQDITLEAVNEKTITIRYQNKTKNYTLIE